MIIVCLYIFLLYCIYLIFRDKYIPLLYIFLIVISILKATFNYRICTLSYMECKMRKVKRDESYINRFLDSIVDIRYSNHIYPLTLIGYSLLYISFIYYLKKSKSK